MVAPDSRDEDYGRVARVAIIRDIAERRGAILERLGHATGVGRVNVYENHLAGHGTLLHSLRHERAAPGVAPVIDLPTNQDDPWGPSWQRWVETLASGGIHHGNAESFPEPIRSGLRQQDVVSIAMVPVFVGDEWWGSIGFECVAEREWTAGEIEALRAAAGTLGAAIGRERAERELMEAQAKYRTLVEQVPAIVYLAEFGPEGDWLYMSPQIERILGYAAEEWMDHPHPFASFVHPDDWSQRRRSASESPRTSTTIRSRR